MYFPGIWICGTQKWPILPYTIGYIPLKAADLLLCSYTFSYNSVSFYYSKYSNQVEDHEKHLVVFPSMWVY